MTPPTESDELHFGLAASRPSISDLRVFETHETRLLGAPVTFHVIGSSHFVHSESLGFYEIASCKTVDGGDVHTLPLSPDLEGEFAFRTGAIACSVEVHAERLAAFDPDREYDLEYAFGPEAHTAVAIHGGDGDDDGDGNDEADGDGAGDSDGEADGDGDAATGGKRVDRPGYETYHTYPEHGLTVVTRTTLDRPTRRRRRADR